MLVYLWHHDHCAENFSMITMITEDAILNFISTRMGISGTGFNASQFTPVSIQVPVLDSDFLLFHTHQISHSHVFFHSCGYCIVRFL